jgi:hypothetical protein
MFRFSLIILTLIALCYIFLPRSNPDARRLAASQQSLGSDRTVLAKLENNPATTETAESPPAASVQPAPPKPETPSVTASVAPAPAHIETAAPVTPVAAAPAPAKVEAADPALAAISDAELPLAAQRELAKLGCYDSRIDGVWGQKSRAAVAEFNKRMTGSWGDEPNRALIGALRSAPAGLCKQSCADGAGGERCIADSAKGKTAADNTAERELSYLPPWMRGQKAESPEAGKPASTESESVTVQAGGTTTAASSSMPPTRETLRGTWSRYRGDYGERRSYYRRRDWAPDGWPRSSR